MPWMQNAPHAGFSTTGGKTWLPVTATHLPLAVDAQADSPESTLNRIRAFLQWRKDSPSLRLGNLQIIETPDPVLAFRRGHGDQTVTCIFNCSDQDAQISADLAGSGQLIGEISHNAVIRDGSMILKPYGYGLLAG